MKSLLACTLSLGAILGFAAGTAFPPDPDPQPHVSPAQAAADHDDTSDLPSCMTLPAPHELRFVAVESQTFASDAILRSPRVREIDHPITVGEIIFLDDVSDRFAPRERIADATVRRLSVHPRAIDGDD